jgi:hypothetical protein
MRVPLRHLAHVRSGDKGDSWNLAVIAYEPELYPVLEEQLSADRVRAHYEGMIAGRVDRYPVPGLGALNFVAQQALGGGCCRNLRLDTYGKALSSAALAIELDVPDELTAKLRNYAA